MKTPFQIKSRVVLADQTVVVSTVDLSWPELGIENKGFETMIFLVDGSDHGSDPGECVEWYPTQEQAIAGHVVWSRPPVVGYVLAAVHERKG